MDWILPQLIAAQDKAQTLFDELVGNGLTRAGKLESRLAGRIHARAHARPGPRGHWHRHRVHDGARALRHGKAPYRRTPGLGAEQRFDLVAGVGPFGRQRGASSAGHRIGRIPQRSPARGAQCCAIRRGNDQRLREPDEHGQVRHWMLEFRCVDRRRMIGGFVEELRALDTWNGSGR